MNPSTGTFTSMDAYAGTVFDPVSLHKYLYANANLVMNRDPSGYFTITEEMSVCAVIGAYSNVTLTMLDIFRQGDNYEGNVYFDTGKSVLSGFLSGFIGGALVPVFIAASLTGGVVACALLILVIMASFFGFLFIGIAESMTPEGSFFDMSIGDQLMFVGGFFFEILGDALFAPIRALMKIPDAVEYGIDLLGVIL